MAPALVAEDTKMSARASARSIPVMKDSGFHHQVGSSPMMPCTSWTHTTPVRPDSCHFELI